VVLAEALLAQQLGVALAEGDIREYGGVLLIGEVVGDFPQQHWLSK
jgi:hypothetical protein